MKRFAAIVPLLLVAALVMAMPLFAADMNNNMNSSSNNMSNFSASAAQTFNAKDLIGRDVKDAQGQSLGEVKDVILGDSGNAEFIVLSRGGILGAGEKYTPVPYKAFMTQSNVERVDSDKDLVLNFDKAKLDSAPSFSNEDWNKQGNNWQHKAECHFGVSSAPC